ncbi:hypothetical protein PMI40_01313 [Herbaspirillum sp. YR522]|nr:hypothetical protein PMI40_01313 [Herbaspirillum sp. YR522]
MIDGREYLVSAENTRQSLQSAASQNIERLAGV